MAKDASQISFLPTDVLDFWFPDTGHHNAPETYAAFWSERMQGGMDDAIISGSADHTHAAETGRLDHWADTPRGRLALIVALDQFPRSLWRSMPAAYAQDINAARLSLEGMANGHLACFQRWEMIFFYIAIAHCESPDHVARMHKLDDALELLIKKLPDQLCESGPRLRAQHQKVKKIKGTCGMHPHRNDITSRPSTPQEMHYISAGDFPHLAKSGK